MNSVVTWSLLGQPLEVVQTYLGPSINHQYSAEKQTDFYLHGTRYLKDVFPVVLTGIISLHRKERCVALRIILNKRDPRYQTFIYNREIATRLFEKVASNDYAYWHEIEAEPKAGDKTHYVYCMGGNIATTWDVSTVDSTIEGDVIIYLDSRCGETDHSVVTRPIFASKQESGTTSQPMTPMGEGEESATGDQKTFPDIADSPYQSEILKAANTYHLLSGYEDGTFKPERAVTRENVIILLLRAMALMLVDAGAIAVPDELETAPFVDVPKDHKSARQFYYANQSGLLAGDDQNKAYPDATLSRAGLMVILRNGLQVVVNENYSTTTELNEIIQALVPNVTYTDIAEHWGEDPIRELTTYGIASAADEAQQTFAPDTDATRGFTAAALVRMLEAQFNRKPGLETKPAPVKTFSDIGSNLYKDEIIKAANQYRIVAGYEDGKFHPTDPLSREQAVALLINAMQKILPPEVIQIPEMLSDPPPFVDVKAGENATKIQFAKSANLVSGDDNGFFRPLDRLSRAQLISMIHNGLSYIVHHDLGETATLNNVLAAGETPLSEFGDVPDTHWAYSLVRDLLPTGIVSAYQETGTSFKPDQSAERDYATAAMVRMIETEISPTPQTKPSPPPTFSDLDDNAYQQEIQLAASQYQMIKGYEDGTFRPNAPVNREQALSILIDALQQRVANKGAIVVPDGLTQPPFSDVPLDRWSAPKLYFAKQAGIIAGDDTRRFFPEAQLGRAQLMAITYQALAYAVWADFGEHKPLDQIFDPGVVDRYSFKDIPNDHWAAGLLPIMGILGLAQPLDPAEPTQFAPDALARRDYTVATGVHMLQLMYTETPQPVGEMAFIDVVSDPYAEAITKAVNRYHIVSGNEDGNFHPLESIHREHLVAMLVAALQHLVHDSEVVKISKTLGEPPFRDVPVGNLFAARIKFVADASIMSGDKDTGLFRPKNDLTRAELMAVLSNTLQFVVTANYGEGTPIASVVDLDEITPSSPFADVPDQHWGKGAIDQMVALGIATPRELGSNEFLPNEPTRRNYATAALLKLIELPFKESPAVGRSGSGLITT